MSALAEKWWGDDDAMQEFPDCWPARILLAEDDADLRRLLAETLRADGYTVLEAEDGEALLDMVASQLLYPVGSPGVLDLIISDVRLPGPSGLWALATLRNMDWATPFLVITAYADESTCRQAQKLGAAALLTKPLDVDDFCATVANLTGPSAADFKLKDPTPSLPS